MSRVRQSYGMPLTRRANSMVGTVPEPMVMERLERKEFDVPQPVVLAMGAAPEVPSAEAEAAPIEESRETTPEDLKYVGVGETGLARQAADAIRQRNKMLEELANE